MRIRFLSFLVRDMFQLFANAILSTRFPLILEVRISMAGSGPG